MSISDRKLKANKANAIKGAEATKRKWEEFHKDNPVYCKGCGKVIPQGKTKNLFCSQSCAARFNNKNKPRKEKPQCQTCGKEATSHRSKYCSKQCAADARKTEVTPEQRRARNAAAQAKYRAKYGYLRAYDPSADKDKIKMIYANCPKGHEVDHIVPLSKGGKHHENNLQYLTVEENRRKSNKLPKIKLIHWRINCLGSSADC